MSAPGNGALQEVLESGAKLCAAQLERISKAAWESAQFSMDETAEEALERMVGALGDDLYGDWFAAPGSAYLIVIPRACGMRLTNRFTKDHAEMIDMLEQRETIALAEISNIIVNSFVTSLAEALDEDLIVSAPTPMLDCTRDLLVKSLSKHSSPGRYAIACLARLGSKALSSELSIIVFLEAATLQRLLARPS